MTQIKIPYNEIDFLIPSYRFNIRFSYITKRGLPFIREFVLRLVHLSPMKPIEVSEYLGLTEREAKEALRDLIERDELVYNELGQVALTSKASGYFTDLGASPQVSDVLTTGTVVGFEATAFNCVSSNDVRLNDKWNCGIRIDPKSEVVANRNKLAEKAFQNQFYSLLDKGFLKNLRDSEGSGRPNIYKIDSVKQIAQEPLRLKLNFVMNENGMSIERDDIEQLKDDSIAQDAITEALFRHGGSNNLADIIQAIECFRDVHSGSLVDEQGFNVSKFLVMSQSQEAQSGKFIPFVGPIYTEANWSLFTEQVESVKKKLVGSHQEGLKALNWLAPSNEFWGRNNKTSNCFNELVSGAKTKGKKAKTLYKPTLILPLNSTNDRFNKNRWKDDFSTNIGNVDAYVEGFHNGVVEVLLLEDELVAVTYHLNLPDIYQVTLPFGFISNNKELINKITSEVDNYLSSLHDFENKRHLGSITKLG